jgi:hypothetical protein
MKEFITINDNDDYQKNIDSKNIILETYNFKELPLDLEKLKINYYLNEKLNLEELLNLKELTFYNIENPDISIELPKNLKKLEIIDIENFDFNNLPENLESIKIKNYKGKIDEIFKHLPLNIKKIKIVNTKLSNYDFVYKFPNLKVLKLKRTGFIDIVNNLPDFIEKLSLVGDYDYYEINIINYPKNLHTLNLSSYDINNLYIDNESLKSLKITVCGTNKIIKIPQNLKKLDISKNQITDDEKIPLNLEKLNISNNQLKKFNFQNYHLLKKLNVGKNYISSVNLENNGILEKLDISYNKISSISKLPETLKKLNVSGNSLTKIPKLNSIKKLECSDNLIQKLPKLPENLEYLDCSKNIITSLSKIPTKLKTLICSYNLIKFLPNMENLEKLDCSNNPLNEIPEVLKIKSINIKNTPIYDKLIYNVREIKLPQNVINYKNFEIDTIIIPKGTIMFKGYDNPKNMINDFIGFNPNKQKYEHNFLFQNHTTFLYPYPYVVNDVRGDDLTIITFVLSQDITIVNQTIPSKNTRNDDKFNNYTTTCDKIELIKDSFGYKIDPCFTKDFLKEYPNISGQICLTSMDTFGHNYIRKISKIDLLKYRKNFMDNSGLIGVPELILHPLKNRNVEPIKTKKSDATFEWLVENMDNYNYFPLYVEDYSKNKSTHLAVMNQLLSPEGAELNGNICHMTIDPLTSFYVIYEMCEEEVQKRCIPIDEPNKLKYL